MPKMFPNSRTPSTRPIPTTTTTTRTNLAALLRADDTYTDDVDPHRTPSRQPATTSCTSSPVPNMSVYSSPGLGALSPSVDHLMWSPWNNLPPASPYIKSPWTLHPPPTPYLNSTHTNNSSSSLVGSLIREQGHVYSLAASDGLLYTGSESKNVRVWCRNQEYSGFKSASGLVKAIVITASSSTSTSLSTSSSAKGGALTRRRVFTGHQDGKIRVWASATGSTTCSPEHRRVGSLPRLRDVLRGSLRPGNYVRVRRGRSALWMRHHDAVSCLCVSGDGELLYSGSWDKTVKVWRLADSRCLESVTAHDDAVNAVAASPPGLLSRVEDRRPLLFTGSADGTVKAWRRDDVGDGSRKHVLVQTLLRVDFAVTSLAVSTGDPQDVGLLPALYAGSSDGLVNFWVSNSQKSERTGTGDLLAHGGTLRGHRLAVLCVVAAGSSLVLSGSADRTVCVWRREGEGGVHSCLSVLNAHQGPVKCLAVEADEEEEEQKRTWFVYSGSLDKSVKVWRVSDSAGGDMDQQRGRLSYRQYSPLLQR